MSFRIFGYSVCIFVLGGGISTAQAKDCASDMAEKGYTGAQLFDETYKCQNGHYPNRPKDTVIKGTIPNDATLKRLQDTVKGSKY